MSGPNQVRIKRKRHESAPDTLIYESRSHKKRELRFQRVEDEGSTSGAVSSEADIVEWRGEGLPEQDQAGGKQVRDRGRRVFQLKRSSGRKEPSDRAKHMPPYEEKHGEPSSAEVLQKSRDEHAGDVVLPAQPLKRPGKGSITAANASSGLRSDPSAARDDRILVSLADELHEFALEELANAPRPRLTAVPKLSNARSRDIHRQRMAATEPRIRDAEMGDTDDADFVYDTYVITTAGEGAAAGVLSNGDLGDVGYLVISEDDQSVWETYLEDEISDKGWDTDDEDENAEDYYGADYPEDELPSDDEFDRNAYHFRNRRGSDDETWDEDTGAYSEDEHDRMMDSWKSSRPPQDVSNSLVDEQERDE